MVQCVSEICSRARARAYACPSLDHWTTGPAGAGGMADIVPRWMWDDPAVVAERLEAMERRQAARRDELGRAEPARDRYYTMARRVEVRGAVKRVMRGGR